MVISVKQTGSSRGGLEMETQEAINEVREAVSQFGVPCWVAHISCPIRSAVPKQIIRELNSSAKVSEGWSRQFDGRLIYGRTNADGVADIFAWAKEHIFEMVTVKQVAEDCDVSESCARRNMNARSDVFKKFGREYEIRDADSDRKAQKK